MKHTPPLRRAADVVRSIAQRLAALGLGGQDLCSRVLARAGWRVSAAARALGQIGPGASTAVPDLIAAAAEERLQDYPHSVEAATDALIRIGISGAPVLVCSLADERSTALAAFVLGHMGPIVVPTLRVALAKDTNGADGAARAVGYLGEGGAPMVPDLVNALREERIDGQAFATAIQGIGPAAADAVPPLIGLLESKNPLTREAAASALLAMGERARPAAEALKKALEEEQDVGIRHRIESALGPRTSASSLG